MLYSRRWTAGLFGARNALPGAYDVAILARSDADMIACVERIQEKAFKVINAAWSGRGSELAQACWASLLIDDIVQELTR